MNITDIRVAIADAVNAFKADTGHLPIRLQVSSVHLSELQSSAYEFPDGSFILVEYVEGMSRNQVRCIGPEVIKNELE